MLETCLLAGIPVGSRVRKVLVCDSKLFACVRIGNGTFSQVPNSQGEVEENGRETLMCWSLESEDGLVTSPSFAEYPVRLFTIELNNPDQGALAVSAEWDVDPSRGASTSAAAHGAPLPPPCQVHDGLIFVGGGVCIPRGGWSPSDNGIEVFDLRCLNAEGVPARLAQMPAPPMVDSICAAGGRVVAASTTGEKRLRVY